MRHQIGNCWTRSNLAKASMRSPSIVVGHEFIDCSLKVLVAQYHSVIETFVADGAHAAFCDRIGLWCFHRGANLLDTQRFNTSIEYDAKAAVTVVDQESGRFC